MQVLVDSFSQITSSSSSLEHLFEASEQLLNKIATLGIDSKDQWMEKIFVSVIWVLTNTTSNEDHSPDRAETAAQILAECGLDKPSGNVTQASLIVCYGPWYTLQVLTKSSSSGSISTQCCQKDLPSLPKNGVDLF